MKYENMDSAWLDIRSAAIKLQISVQAVHALTDRGTLAFKWMGGRKFVKLETLQDLVRNTDFQKRSRATSTRRRSELLGQDKFELGGGN
jgi:hypothetical protein